MVNAIGGPTLVTKGSYVHQMYAPGYLGTKTLVERKQPSLTWKDVDFLRDLKVSLNRKLLHGLTLCIRAGLDVVG